MSSSHQPVHSRPPTLASMQGHPVPSHLRLQAGKSRTRSLHSHGYERPPPVAPSQVSFLAKPSARLYPLARPLSSGTMGQFTIVLEPRKYRRGPCPRTQAAYTACLPTSLRQVSSHVTWSQPISYSSLFSCWQLCGVPRLVIKSHEEIRLRGWSFFQLVKKREKISW